MPVLRQALAQQTPGGLVRGVIPGAVDVGGLAYGVNAAAQQVAQADAYTAHRQERLKEKQEHEARQLAIEEAQGAVTKAVSEGTAYWTEQLANGQNAPSAEGFTSNTLKDFDAWSGKQLESAPELGRKLMANRLQTLRLHVHERAFDFETKTRRAAVISDFSAARDADNRTLQADPSQFTALVANGVAAANQLTLDPKTKADLIEHTRESLAFAAASGIVDRNPDSFLEATGQAGGKTGKDGKPLPVDPKKAAAAVAESPILSNLKPAHLQSLVERATTLSVTRKAQAEAEAERRRARAEAEANKREREAITAYTVLSDRARNGIATDPSTDPVLMRQLSGSPALMKAYQEQAADIPKRAAVAQLPLAEQQAQLDALKAHRVSKGTNTELEREIKKREESFAAAKRDFADEPLRAVAERGIIRAVAPLNTANLDTIEQGLQARSQQAYTAGAIGGKAVSPMMHDEATAWASQINALPFNERGGRIARLTNLIGPQQAQALAAQIDQKDRALALELAVGSTQTTQGRTVGELIRRGAQAVKDKAVKDDPAIESGTRARLAQEAHMFNGKAREDVIDAARYIMLGKEAAGERMDPRGAIELAIGGKLIEHNGSVIPAPAQFTEERFKAGLAALKPSDLSSRVMYLPDGQPISPEEFLRRLPSAALEPAGAGRYYVKGSGGFIIGENRRPVAVEVK